LCCGWRGRPAQPQGPRPPLDVWESLLLVLSGNCRFGDRAFRGALGRELSSVPSRRGFTDCRYRCTDGFATPVGQLCGTSHYRDGAVVRSDADCFLCRQRQALAAVEGASSDCVLVDARWVRNTANPVRVVETSADATAGARKLSRFAYRLARVRQEVDADANIAWGRSLSHSLIDTGRPAAFHSGRPSSNLRALKPRLRSRATASNDMTQ